VPSILGNAVLRSEDPPLLTGEARFVADLPAPGALHAAFVRSSTAHALISKVDLEAARSAPGVVAVAGAADLELPLTPVGASRVGGPVDETRTAVLGRPRLARERVRYVGEPVAVVVAETPAAAADAAELVSVELQAIEAVVDSLAALERDAPLLFPDHGTNVVVDDPTADGSAEVLEGAEVVIRERFVNQRLAPVPLEPSGVLAVPRPDGGVDVWATTQAPFRLRDEVAAALGLRREQVRGRAPAVGGGFGAKGGVYPEMVVVPALALRLGRPVRWVETRSENLVGMTHGRAQVQDVELGAQRDGTLVGLRARLVTDVGAYAWRGTFIPQVTKLMTSGTYRIPRLAVRPMGVVTNTTPTGPYRGAGRPEAAALVERSMDLLADELGMDPVEVRRRNLIEPSEFPYSSPAGASYDSGNYRAALDRALELADYEQLRREQAARRAGGGRPLLGIGVSCYVEVSGSGSEYGSVEVRPDGTVTVTVGTSPHGQGHETAFAQVAASVLEVPFELVRVVHSDTGVVPRGVGTFGSRSGQLGGSAVYRAGEVVAARARRLAAQLLEASEEDLVRGDDGSFGVAGVPSRRLSWGRLAAAGHGDSRAAAQDSQVAAAHGDETGDGADSTLFAEVDFSQQGTFPFGAQVAVVEVDPETGKVWLRRLVAVDDCGTVINPMIVAGQTHGGLAQGVAQALFEGVSYDEAGNPLTSSLLTYCVPSAAELPSWEIDHTVTPSPRNPLGAKGAGEAATTGSPPAVQNAVIDALKPYGVRHLDLPLTPERVWRAINRATASPS
jgi:carbon-monoxide dehydrogenase large subunit